MKDLLWDQDLAFLDDWSLKSDGNSGNTKTEVRLSPQYDNANSSLNVTVSVPVRTACEKHTNLVHPESAYRVHNRLGGQGQEGRECGVTVRRDLLSSRIYYWL